MVVGQTPVPAGILSLSDLGCQTPGSDGRLRLALLTPQGQLLTLETDEKIGAMAWQFLPVNDHATVIVTRVKATRHIVAYVVRRQEDRLTLERMPELSIPYRGDFAAAIAGPTETAQLMILGGSDGQYRGCMECRNDTHLLNLETRTWSAGPPMLEARSELGATRLPDGSVLVTGGWTKQAKWGRGPSTTAERWDPTTHRFEAITPMPTGTARHGGVWLPGQEGKSLLITGGLSGTAQAFDVATQTWRTVAEWVEGSEEGGCGFLPFTFEGNAYAWALRRSEGHYSSKACMEQKFADLSLLRPLAGTAPPKVPPPESFLVTYRSGATFLPAAAVGNDERPAMIIGGTTHAGMNAYNVTSSVEAVGRDGRIWALPSLHNARVQRAGISHRRRRAGRRRTGGTAACRSRCRGQRAAHGVARVVRTGRQGELGRRRRPRTVGERCTCAAPGWQPARSRQRGRRDAVEAGGAPRNCRPASDARAGAPCVAATQP